MDHTRNIWAALCVALLFAVTMQAQTLTRGPYLQTGTTSSVTVRWRTDSATDSLVRYGTNPAALSLSVASSTSTKEHELRVTGLAANTTYYYSIGSNAKVLGAGSTFSFTTAPTGAKPTRIWLLGSAGTGDANAIAVRDAYATFAGTRRTDLLLMLGDSGLTAGTDADYTRGLFGIYGGALRQAVLWSAYGDRDALSADAATRTGPYFQQHTFPTKAEAGGVGSGTEAYYSFDYADIHVVVLDSAESSTAVGSAQLAWLGQDLAANRKAWTIAVVHHAPYTRGPEHSDNSALMTAVRKNVLPILESHGVDLVVSGHSPGYERSYFLNGHYGTASSFNRAAMVVQSGNGRLDGDGAYVKDTEIVATPTGPQLTLEWDDNSADETGFRIERALGTGSFAEIGRVSANVTSFRDDTVEAGKTYSYRVRAFNGAGNSAYSNTAKGVAPAGGTTTDANNAFSGTVYVVVGASGATASAATNHPAMYTSMSVLGSLVVDINGAQLDGQYVDSTGTRRDYFTIRKKDFVAAPANQAPSVRVTSPASGTSLVAGGTLTLNASASDADGTVRKVEFLAGGKLLGSDTSVPYSFVWAGVPEGAQTVTARATDDDGATTTSQPVLVHVTTGAVVKSFSLMNAQTDRPVPGYESIVNGAVIPRDKLPSQLSIRVNTSPATVGSVRIGWGGSSNYRVESLAPYALFGGDGADFLAGSIADGRHTITATPYSKSGGAGVAGTPVKVSFTIASRTASAPQTAAQAVTSFTLINADTDKPVAGHETIANGAVISRAKLPTSRLSIRVNTSPATVGSVRIGWGGKASYRTESEAPYALFGGSASDYSPGTLANGSHTIVATPFTKADAAGTAGKSRTITFKIQ